MTAQAETGQTLEQKMREVQFPSDVARVALAAGYSMADLQAGFLFFRRKNAINKPPGAYDRARRFTAAERTPAVRSCRAPSREHPYSELRAACTAKHCAEVIGNGAVDLHVKRIAKAHEASRDGAKPDELARILKPVKKPKAALESVAA